MAATTNTSNKKSTAKKSTIKGLLQAMYPALVKAHNDGNRKAIDRQRCADLDISPATLATWELKVKELQAACFEYVEMRHNSAVPGTDVDDGAMYAARERIFPIWKNVLRAGNDTDTPQYKKLRVRESDVEILTEFAWTFFAPNAKTYTCGTQVAPQTAYNFRKLVESHLGVRIAENVMLTADERDTLLAYHSAQTAKTNAQAAKVDAEDEVKKWDKLIAETPDTKENIVIRKYLQEQRTASKAKVDQAEEAEIEANGNIQKYASSAKAIQDGLKEAKIK